MVAEFELYCIFIVIPYGPYCPKYVRVCVCIDASLVFLMLVLLCLVPVFLLVAVVLAYLSYRHFQVSKQGAPGAGMAVGGAAGGVTGYTTRRSFIDRLWWRVRHSWHSFRERVPSQGHVRFENDEASIAGIGFQADPSGDASLPVRLQCTDRF